MVRPLSSCYFAFFPALCMILTLGGQQAYNDVLSNASVLPVAGAKPTRVPDDWDNDDEEVTDSQKIGKPRTPYHSNSPFVPPFSGDSRKLLEIRA